MQINAAVYPVIGFLIILLVVGIYANRDLKKRQKRYIGDLYRALNEEPGSCSWH